MSDLKKHVQTIIAQIEGRNTDWKQECEEPEYASAFDYLQDVLDIEYVVTGAGDYIGARALVAYGGPNIWIDTRNKQVIGAWWSDSYSERYFEDSIGLDEALRELWECR